MSQAGDEGLRRDVSFSQLLWISTGTTLGSGWLFAAFVALTIAGPAALIAWVIASAMMTLLALVHAELGGMFPESGGTSRYPAHAFGTLAGATFGWFSYLQAVTIAPIEVLAAIQYLSTLTWAHGLYNVQKGALTGPGIVVAIGLMGLFVTINLLGIRLLARTNSAITVLKVVVPAVTIAVLLVTHFHASNFTAAGGFFVHGGIGPVNSILSAIASGGIIFCLMGFEGALQVGGESASPQRDLPRAVIGAFLICTAIYIGAQVAFLGALEPATLTHLGTWERLGSVGPLARAPFFTLAAVLGLGWLSWLLRVDAVVSPAGTGLLYLTEASRLSFGLSRNGYVPRIFMVEEPKTDVPALGVILSSLLGLLFLLPFPSWGKLVSVVTGAACLMYAGAPLSLGALRRRHPAAERSYRLPVAAVLAPVAFAFANFIVYWSGWQTVSTLMLALGFGYLLMWLSRRLHLDEAPPAVEWAAARWLAPYLVGMTVISYVGDFGRGAIIGGIGPFHDVLVGGTGRLPLWWDLVVISAFSVLVYQLAMASQKRAGSGAPAEATREATLGP